MVLCPPVLVSLSLLRLCPRFPVVDVCNAADPLAGWLPYSTDAHTDFDLLWRDVFQYVQNPHAWRRAIDLDHGGNLRLFEAPHIPADVAKRERDDFSGILHIDPFVRRTKAALTKHPRRNHNARALIAAPRDQPSLFKLLQVAADRFAGVPRIAELRDVRLRKTFSALQFSVFEWRPAENLR